MKQKQIMAVGIISALMLGSVQAQNVTVIGTGDPGAVSSELEGFDAGVGYSREVNHTDAQRFVLGQSFTLSAGQVAGGGFQLGELFLRSATPRHFDRFVGDLQINFYQGEGAGATLLDTYSFDMVSYADGDTNSADVAGGDWVRFTLAGGGTNLTAAGVYSFLMFWEQSSGADDFNKWAFARTANPGDVYAGGVQYENTSFVPTDWPNAAWTGTAAANAGVRDLGFYVSEALIGNSAPVANDLTATVYENSSVDIILSGADLDGDELTFSIDSSPTNGILTGTVTNLTYTPTGGPGADSFTYVANDGTDDSAPATVSITIEPDIGIIVGTVTTAGATPPDGPFFSHTEHTNNTSGVRELRWETPDLHSVIGQTFTAEQSGLMDEINLLLRSSESFGDYASKTFYLKVFEGGLQSTTELGTYEFNVQSLGSVSANTWLSFGLGSGIEVTEGTLYSFLMAFASEDGDHRLNFERNKSSGEYAGGNELRGGNSFDIANFLSDPWDIDVPIGQSVADNSGDMIMTVGGTTGPIPTPYETWAQGWGLTGSDTNLTADLEPDGVNNLYEYALGGNPTNDDAAVILPVYSLSGGYMYYVYNRRDDAAERGLTYDVLSGTDLTLGPISDPTEFVGAVLVGGGFESATNRISTAVEANQFMKLQVDLSE